MSEIGESALLDYPIARAQQTNCIEDISTNFDRKTIDPALRNVVTRLDFVTQPRDDRVSRERVTRGSASAIVQFMFLIFSVFTLFKFSAFLFFTFSALMFLI